MNTTPAGTASRQPAHSVRYRVDSEERVVYVTLRGDVTFADLCQAEDEMLGDPQYVPGMSVYVDCSVVTSIPSEQAIRKLALDRLLLKASIDTGRSAIVAATPLGLEYARAWDEFTDAPSELGVFNTHDRATEWLGLAAPGADD